MQKATKWAPFILGVAMQIAAYVMPLLHPSTSILILRSLLLFSAFLIFVSIVIFSYGFISKNENVKKLPRWFIITLIIGFVFGGFETWLYNKLNPESSIKELLDIKQSDNQHLNDVVFITYQYARLNENIDGQPYIDFHFFIFNGSVFTIYFTKKIEGKAIYKGTVLKDIPEIESPDSDLRFSHGEKDIHVTLRQWLPFNIKNKINEENNKEKIEFNLNNVNILINVVGDLINNSHRLKLEETVFPLRL